MWPNPQKSVDLFVFTEDILNGKLQFFCSETAPETSLKLYARTQKPLVRIIGTKYSRMNQAKFFKGCLSQSLH